MKRLLRNRVFESLAIGWVGYWVAAPWLPKPVLFEIINALAVAVSVMFIVTYAPGAWRSLRERWEDINSGHFIATGMVLIWSAILARTIWNLVWRMSGKPDWMVDHLFPAFTVYVLLSGGILCLMYKEQQHDFTEENWRRLGVIAGLSAMFTAILVTLLGYG